MHQPQIKVAAFYLAGYRTVPTLRGTRLPYDVNFELAKFSRFQIRRIYFRKGVYQKKMKHGKTDEGTCKPRASAATDPPNISHTFKQANPA